MNKNCTSLEQSKKLAEILPLESADMCYGIDDDTLKYNNLPWLIPYHKYTAKEFYTPCWSLAALLNVLPKGTRLLKSATDDIYHCDCPKCNIDEWFDNPIDACYKLLLKLYELKML